MSDWHGPERREGQQEILQRLDQLRTTQLEMKVILTGNGDPSKGLVLKVDRLEQEQASRIWMTRAILVAVLGLILKSLFDAYWTVTRLTGHV